ncbi:DJ-1/PfpI family protein [Xylaria bambusicola]|uniref:DJ-1/PfpI family protein n=1 Tax=Xylaria bambusicola TaxID=326684 RepID=UPI002007F4A4|nr:DJ-1/PfpI family protein [Xylaria bambusicola]KAI0512860.1 DJ-1/PfpI family protein [Xylaria bambusicola]
MFKTFVPYFLQWVLATALVADAAGPLRSLRHTPGYPPIKPRCANETIPKNFAVVTFRAMLLQDMVGVIDPLQVLALENPMNLYILAETMDPVTPEPAMASMNKFNSSFFPTINPTHTFDNAPDDIEVLIVPGGPGVRAPNVTHITDFIRDRYPKLKYLLTVCTGAGLAAKSGVLDGRKATTNKGSWATITSYGPNTTWVSPARWVVDGNIWSSSGVTAGMDLTFAWIKHIWGQEAVDLVTGREEYVPNPQTFDPFATRFNITPTGSI